MRRPRPRALLEVAVWWAVLLCLWLLFVSGATPAELGAGAGAAGIATGVAVLAFRAMRVHFVPRPAWALALHRLPPQLALDTWLVCSTLARPLGRRGPRGRHTTLRAGGPGETGRALLTVLLSLPPNTIVVGFADDGDEVLVHQLVERPVEVPRLR